MHQPVLSVGLCTYDGEPYLDEQLQSILCSSVVPDEIIICDDRSKDTTRERVLLWIGKYPRIQLYENQETLGVTKNFEKALSLTTGGIIFLCDHDDRWDTDKVAKISAEFGKRPDLLMLHTNAHLIDASGMPMGCSLFEALELSENEIRQIKTGNAFNALLRRNLVTGATAALRRGLLNAALPFPKEWVHDEWLAIIAAAIGSVDFLYEKLIDYRQHSRNEIGMRKLSFFQKVKKAFARRTHSQLQRVRRTEVLLERLVSLGSQVAPNRIAMVREKLLHHEARARLPKQRLLRTLPIIKEIMTGRYHRYATGFHSIVFDLIEEV